MLQCSLVQIFTDLSHRYLIEVDQISVTCHNHFCFHCVLHKFLCVKKYRTVQLVQYVLAKKSVFFGTKKPHLNRSCDQSQRCDCYKSHPVTIPIVAILFCFDSVPSGTLVLITILRFCKPIAFEIFKDGLKGDFNCQMGQYRTSVVVFKSLND